MIVLKVVPKDISVTMEIGLTDLRKLRDGLALANINFNGEDNAEREAADYTTKVFYPQLNELVEDLDRGA